MRLFKKRHHEEDALVDRTDRGKVYDLRAKGASNTKKEISSTKKNKKTPNRKPKDRYEPTSPFRSSPHNHPNIPVIDRIPTAIGYHSDGSEEEWFEEKSKHSRYDAADDDDEEGRDEVALSDDEDQGDDKYSLGRNSQADGIERLWSEDSFDSTPRQQTWDQFAEKRKIESYYKPGDVSYLAESKNDPIYESPRKSPFREAIVVAPDLHEQSVAESKPRTRKLSKEILSEGSDEPATEKTDTTERMKELDEPSTESKTESKDTQPESLKSQTEQTIPVSSSVKLDQKASEELDAMVASESSSNDPFETLAATDMLVKEIESKLKTLKATAAKEKRAVKKLQREMRRSRSRGRSMEKSEAKPKRSESKKERGRSKSVIRSASEDPATASEVAKSLFNGFTVMLFRKTDKSAKQTNESQKSVKLANDSDSEPPMLEAKLERHHKGANPGAVQPVQDQTGMEHTMAPMDTDRNVKSDATKSEIPQNKATPSLWNLRQRSLFGKPKKEEIDIVQEDLQHPLSPTLSDPPEHDEYSVDYLPIPQAPALVQCLKFYACPGVAERVGEIIKTADRYRDATIAACGSPTYSMTEPTVTTPKPTVEVVLEEIDRPEDVVNEAGKSQAHPKRGFFGQKCIEASVDLTPEAPALVNSKGKTRVLNVTGMQLHLDGDSEPDVEEQSRGEDSHASNSRVSVTSIKVPRKTEKIENPACKPPNRPRLPRFLKKRSSRKET